MHPFYLVYVRDDSVVHMDHLQSKKLLDAFRRLCKGRALPDPALCERFQLETNDGKDMRHYSDLLGLAVQSVMQRNGDDVLDGFLSGNPVSLATKTIEGLNDFELVCFLTVK